MGTAVPAATARVVFGCQQVGTAGIGSHAPLGNNQNNILYLGLISDLSKDQGVGERGGMKFRTLEVT